MADKIKAATEYLFKQNFFDDNFDPDGAEVNLDKAQELMEQYPWNDIIVIWHDYLYRNCRTPEEVINFANLFLYYGGTDGYNPEPYKFLGYMLYRVDMDKYYDTAYSAFEAIALDILGYQNLINLRENPYYDPLKDPHILNAVKKWENNTY